MKDLIKSLKFTDELEKYLRKIFPHMTEEYFAWMKQDFSERISFRAMKEG